MLQPASDGVVRFLSLDPKGYPRPTGVVVVRPSSTQLEKEKEKHPPHPPGWDSTGLQPSSHKSSSLAQSGEEKKGDPPQAKVILSEACTHPRAAPVLPLCL